ncbi:putative uncharacterized protein [Waddlia chondrophila 2032/99]|uniref:Uncharacterized protein n=1 Tax=Waddlia chondrophila 2032/99 TaxID=765953 RepID=F8LA24_9BACT|nr:putative uncharacterized protein [Waddlia chondrophila 2032/99]
MSYSFPTDFNSGAAAYSQFTFDEKDGTIQLSNGRKYAVQIGNSTLGLNNQDLIKMITDILDQVGLEKKINYIDLSQTTITHEGVKTNQKEEGGIYKVETHDERYQKITEIAQNALSSLSKSPVTSSRIVTQDNKGEDIESLGIEVTIENADSRMLSKSQKSPIPKHENRKTYELFKRCFKWLAVKDKKNFFPLEKLRLKIEKINLPEKERTTGRFLEILKGKELLDEKALRKQFVLDLDRGEKNLEILVGKKSINYRKQLGRIDKKSQDISWKDVFPEKLNELIDSDEIKRDIALLMQQGAQASMWREAQTAATQKFTDQSVLLNQEKRKSKYIFSKDSDGKIILEIYQRYPVSILDEHENKKDAKKDVKVLMRINVSDPNSEIELKVLL